MGVVRWECGWENGGGEVGGWEYGSGAVGGVVWGSDGGGKRREKGVCAHLRLCRVNDTGLVWVVIVAHNGFL